MKKGFTLIELLISITILSIMMLFLYKSYASLNHSNSFYKKEVNQIKEQQLLKKVFFLDFSLALGQPTILNQETKENALLLQSSNSLHNRYNPYIAYIVKDFKLYRLESLKKLFLPLSADSEFSVDYLGEINSFSVYKFDKTIEKSVSQLFLLHVDFKNEEDILLKIKSLEN
ncbi:MAG: prepilin-type N-terminal cleavage/methylation domain-containing protein [Campylobacterales bacterium]|nr:prepilin-type N-terminal cleavage/methylation domain-containing protein [Campylobacterales bacterium]